MQLDEELTLGPDQGPTDDCPSSWTLTSGATSRVVIYPHGFGVRVKLTGSKDTVNAALTAIGWSPTGAVGWKTMKSGRWVLGGAAWLSHTAPGVGRKPKQTPTLKFNKSSSVRLYSLGISRTEGQVHIEIQGVRHGDIKTTLETVCGLHSTEWCIDHYTRAERYVVLNTPDAEAVARGLGSIAQDGRGPNCRKTHLVKDYPLTVEIRSSAKSTALLSVYRIKRGATYTYKMEVCLKGHRRDRKQFTSSDISKLNLILLDIVDRFNLRPLLKPGRWEPRNRLASVETGPFDEAMRSLGWKAWRGTAMPLAEVRRTSVCHTLPPQSGVTPIEKTRSDRAFVNSIRSPSQNLGNWSPVVSTNHPMDVVAYARGVPVQIHATRVPTTSYEAIALELANLPGCLAEVILPEDVNPYRTISAIVEACGGRKIGIGVLGVHTWLSVTQLLSQHPLTNDTENIILVVDPTSMAHWVDSLERELHKADSMKFSDIGRAEVQATAANLWEYLRFIRDSVEKTNGLVVIVSVDSRSPSGKGDLRLSHRWTDQRIRSTLGDAARYWCHARYLVEYRKIETRSRIIQRPIHVTLIKDEIEGLVGRRLTWRTPESEATPEGSRTSKKR